MIDYGDSDRRKALQESILANPTRINPVLNAAIFENEREDLLLYWIGNADKSQRHKLKQYAAEYSDKEVIQEIKCFENYRIHSIGAGIQS